MRQYARQFARGDRRMHRIALSVFCLMLVSLFVLGSSPLAAGLLASPADKLVHLLFYFLMTLLLWLGLPDVRPWWPALAVTLVGCVDEVNQNWLPGRYPGFDDFVADLLGILLAVIGISLCAFRRVFR